MCGHLWRKRAGSVERVPTLLGIFSEMNVTEPRLHYKSTRPCYSTFSVRPSTKLSKCRGEGEDGCTIYSFICLSAGGIEWQPSCSATILLFYAPPKRISVLVRFVIIGDSFQFIIIQVGLHRLLLLLQWPFLQPSFLPFSLHS